MVCDFGLGYVPLSQRVDQLSGGELQRLRIANKLWPADAKGWIVILDEPTAGLHPEDIDRLLVVLDRIVSSGLNTLVLIEHNIAQLFWSGTGTIEHSPPDWLLLTAVEID